MFEKIFIHVILIVNDKNNKKYIYFQNKLDYFILNIHTIQLKCK